MGRAFFNSFIVMVFVLLVSVIVGTQLAFILNRFTFPGNGLVRSLYLFASLLPSVAMQVTVYNVMSSLHLVNTLYGYIIMMCGTDVISIYIFIQFMENIPISLDESAIIDGASYWQIYWKIILPLLKPAIMTACILKGVSSYHCDLSLYIRRPDGKPVQPDMRRRYHFISAGSGGLRALSGSDLLRYHRRSGKRIEMCSEAFCRLKRKAGKET